MRSALLSRLFPSAVVTAELRGAGDPAALMPDEALDVARAVPKRVQEFAAGRACARRALAAFGIRDFPLRAAADRQPRWPADLVGSITHTTGFCGAAVAERSQIRALGLDCENIGAPGLELWPLICGTAELTWVHSLPAREQSAAVTLLFSAKEAFYKCQYPLTGEWLDFHDLRVDATPWGELETAFSVSATRQIAFAAYATLPLAGLAIFHGDLVAAAVCLPVQ